MQYSFDFYCVSLFKLFHFSNFFTFQTLPQRCKTGCAFQNSKLNIIVGLRSESAAAIKVVCLHTPKKKDLDVSSETLGLEHGNQSLDSIASSDYNMRSEHNLLNKDLVILSQSSEQEGTSAAATPTTSENLYTEQFLTRLKTSSLALEGALHFLKNQQLLFLTNVADITQKASCRLKKLVTSAERDISHYQSSRAFYKDELCPRLMKEKRIFLKVERPNLVSEIGRLKTKVLEYEDRERRLSEDLFSRREDLVVKDRNEGAAARNNLEADVCRLREELEASKRREIELESEKYTTLNSEDGKHRIKKRERMADLLEENERLKHLLLQSNLLS